MAPERVVRKTCRAHCTACNRHFSSVSAFDAHRAGDPDDRYCLEPEEAIRRKRGGGVEVVLMLLTEDGVCGLWPRVGEDNRTGEIPMRTSVAVWATGFEGLKPQQQQQELAV